MTTNMIAKAPNKPQLREKVERKVAELARTGAWKAATKEAVTQKRLSNLGIIIGILVIAVAVKILVRHTPEALRFSSMTNQPSEEETRKLLNVIAPDVWGDTDDVDEAEDHDRPLPFWYEVMKLMGEHLPYLEDIPLPKRPRKAPLN